ncbi:TetR/AcrR family transcriptional regulator [Caballeronia novacaledonica]|uniref:TetR/AcrR family transcriptional regulator n=1 Tax=Caballeronia novacaledonica TaxID=1544861 RepID=A0ACB5QQ74_9BURK|nr:TetR family transcriptional regulator [Caballeronia megalochromosomata]GJH17345.1 TetR/AcrR family transcriptional regulator [Caballeronia novacaledonica]
MSEASAPLVKRDPEGTRRRILAAATEQFTSHGLAGARVDAIARAADTNERMLYYYYGSKEGLYVAVLEEMYADYASREAGLDLADLTPTAAITLLAQTIWTYVRENPGWLCLINNENLHQGRYVKGSGKVKQTISPVVEMLRATLARGVATGEFKRHVDALNFCVTLVGMSFYVVSSRFTLEEFLGRDFMEQSAQDSISNMQLGMLLAYLRAPSDPLDAS